MNQLQDIIDNFSIQSEVIFNGSFCGEKSLQTTGKKHVGHLHYLHSGVLTVLTDSGHKKLFDRPTIILLPSDTSHQIISAETEEVKLVCATVHFKALEEQRLIASLPNLISLSLEEESMIETVAWLFYEAEKSGLGQKSIMGKLCDILLIKMLRNLSEAGLTEQSLLAGLSHPLLASIITQLQASPEKPWTLDSMAESAAMSRSKFADLFRETLGQTPNDFLTDLRVSMAQKLLIEGKPVSFVANQVGYEHGSVLARVFRKKTNLSPKEWLQQYHAE
ncbi:AraC family transcriptional regulator [Marinomonas sp. C2222]|uniref:AraC family transcriptional regulator n=1 Tax=Marinomonas sargassi TaxID=2984494 RepID=A0ABT2YTB7_9GAMM|nr:AraC family transcriptional regulator [Marinomonas sargassi]MCV2403144.1 AraC family transcriptional regulator [Marinomonas sargassi]